MSNYSQLKAAINAAITANGQNEITGTILNQILTAMVNSLGAGYHCMGVATPSTNPNSPDQNVFYFATEGGTYSNFGGITLQDGISVLLWNGTWTSQTWFTIDSNPTSGSSNFVMSGGVYEMITGLELEDTASAALQPTQKNIVLRYNKGTEQDPDYINIATLVLADVDDTHAGLMPAKNLWKIVRVDAEQLFTNAEKRQARANIGADTTADEIAVGEINQIDLADVTGSSLKATQKTLNLRHNEGTEEEPNYNVLSQVVLGQATDEEAGLLPAKSEWDDEPTAGSDKLVKSGGIALHIVYDISEANSGATYADLAAALDSGNNIPESIRKGGMSIKFIQSSDNKYVQYRLMATSFSTNESDWDRMKVSVSQNTLTTDNEALSISVGGVDYNIKDANAERFVGHVEKSLELPNNTWKKVANVDIKEGETFLTKVIGDNDWTRIILAYNAPADASKYYYENYVTGRNADVRINAQTDINSIYIVILTNENVNANVEIISQNSLDIKDIQSNVDSLQSNVDSLQSNVGTLQTDVSATNLKVNGNVTQIERFDSLIERTENIFNLYPQIQMATGVTLNSAKWENIMGAALLNTTPPSIASNSGYNTTAFLPIEGGATYISNIGIRCKVYFDNNLAQISNDFVDNAANTPFTTPNNASYMRVSITTDYWNAISGLIVINKGTSVIDYKKAYKLSNEIELDIPDLTSRVVSLEQDVSDVEDTIDSQSASIGNNTLSITNLSSDNTTNKNNISDLQGRMSAAEQAIESAVFEIGGVTYDSEPTQGSSKAVQSSGVYQWFKNLKGTDNLAPKLNTNPVENLIRTHSMFACIHQWGICGASYDSGEMNYTEGGVVKGIDMYDYSWLQILCRMNGVEGYNFSWGGNTAKAWCQSNSSRGWAGAETNLKQAYIISFGENDQKLFSDAANPLYHDGNGMAGSLATDIVSTGDYTPTNDTFAGWIACLIQRIKSVQPKAVFIVKTMWHNREDNKGVNTVLRDLPNYFTNVYIADIWTYYPSNMFDNVFFTDGHPNALGYEFIAVIFNTYIDYIIRNNYAQFNQVQFIGTEYEYDD